jgi:hypothetical protein
MAVDTSSNASKESFDLITQLRIHRGRLARLNVFCDLGEEFVGFVGTFGELGDEFVDVCGTRGRRREDGRRYKAEVRMEGREERRRG